MWLNIILPSVFPYLILSRYLAESDIADIVLKFPGKFLSKALGISYPALRCVLCSVLCGYPSGAVAASALYKNSEISKDEAEGVICYSNNAGPLFLISAVGGSMLGSQRLGLSIYIIQLISAFSYGVIFKPKTMHIPFNKKTQVSSKFDLCSAVSGSVTVIINIFGYMAAAFIMARICIIFLGKFIPMYEETDIIINGLFEISAGVKSAVMIENQHLSFALICAFVSWSGVSVILQIKSAASGLIALNKLIYAKLMQSAMSFILGYAYISLTKTKYGVPFKEDMITISALCTVIIFAIYIIKSIMAKKEHSH